MWSRTAPARFNPLEDSIRGAYAHLLAELTRLTDRLVDDGFVVEIECQHAVYIRQVNAVVVSSRLRAVFLSQTRFQIRLVMSPCDHHFQRVVSASFNEFAKL